MRKHDRGCCPARSQDQAGSRQARDGRDRARPDAQGAGAVREGDGSRGDRLARARSIKTTPVFKNQIRPFARQILPVDQRDRARDEGTERSVPEAREQLLGAERTLQRVRLQPRLQPGRVPVLPDWANHDFNSAVSTADAHGPLGQTLAYFNCEVVPILKGAGEVNPTVRLLLGLLNPPTGAACAAARAENSERRARGQRLHELDGPARRARGRRVRPEPRQRQAVRGRSLAGGGG